MGEEGTRDIVDRVIADVGGAFATGLAYIGDRLGMFRALADAGPLGSAELAGQIGLDERYVREWLKAMVSAGYLEAGEGRYFMTPAQRAVLAEEGSPVFAAGAFQFALPSLGLTGRLIECFQKGGGIPYRELGEEIAVAIDRMHRPWFEHHLTQTWLPAVPGLTARLRSGLRILDVGCGMGRSTIAIARAWPACRVTGLDPDTGSILQARRLAASARVGARFLELALADLPDSERFDLAVAIDCVHDMAEPVEALRRIRAALADDGLLFWSEPTGSADPMANRGSVEKMRANLSPFHCLTVSLAEGGRALGTIMGLDLARRMASEAGFNNLDRLPVESRMQQFFLLRR